MRFAEALQHYGTQAAIARALGIQPAAVAQWAAIKRIPLLRQHQIERLTGGALKADDPVTATRRPAGSRHPLRRAADQVLTAAEVRAEVDPERAAQAEGGALMLPVERK